MRVPTALERDLRALSAALDGADADLVALLTDLAGSVRGVVESYLGLAVLVGPAADGAPGILDEGCDLSPARASLFVGAPATSEPLPPWVPVGVVLFARTPGAFVDLAADASWLGIGAHVRLDEHVPLPAGWAAGAGVAVGRTPHTYVSGQGAINQALGVLVAGGATLEEARAALGSRARGAGVTAAAAARGLLAELDARARPEG